MIMQYQRVRKIINMEVLRKKTVTIVGLGSLGSFTALLLAKNGVNLNLIDFDKISVENLSSQLYSRKDIKKYKASIITKGSALFLSAKRAADPAQVPSQLISAGS